MTTNTLLVTVCGDNCHVNADNFVNCLRCCECMWHFFLHKYWRFRVCTNAFFPSFSRIVCKRTILSTHCVFFFSNLLRWFETDGVICASYDYYQFCIPMATPYPVPHTHTHAHTWYLQCAESHNKIDLKKMTMTTQTEYQNTRFNRFAIIVFHSFYFIFSSSIIIPIILSNFR